MIAAALGEEGRAIDRLCDAFEAEWKANRRPVIETYLEGVAAPLRTRLLGELLSLEMEYRLRQGERLAPAEYQQRFAQDADVVAAAYSKSMSIMVSTAVDPGLTSLTLKVVEGPNKGQSFLFGGAQIFLLGRSKKTHLAVQDQLLSRFQFMIEVNPPVCRLTDLESRNGTWVNGQRVKSVELRDGDTIKAGQTVLQVNAQAAPQSCDDQEAVMTYLSPEPAPASNPITASEDPYRTHPPTPKKINGAPDELHRTLPSAGKRMTSAVIDPEFPCIKGYLIERVLGRGGMGVVYLARREKDNLRLALKTITPAVTPQARQMQLFLREVNILGQLRHKRIVLFHGADECDGMGYFTMEYIEGTDAARMLKDQGILSVTAAVRMVCQLLSALKYAHEMKFVHRDIKPANMLIAEDNGKKSVKLADFGLARVYQESQLSGLTMLGDVGGTIDFMPPEQITKFRNVTPAADQYSSAATLYNLLTGQRLFDFKHDSGHALTLILQEPPVPIQKRRPELPKKLAHVIHRALAKEAEDRFPNVQEFRKALIPFAASSEKECD